MRRADYPNPVPEGNEMRGGNFAPLPQPGIRPRMPPINANETILWSCDLYPKEPLAGERRGLGHRHRAQAKATIW